MEKNYLALITVYTCFELSQKYRRNGASYSHVTYDLHFGTYC